MGVSGLWPVLGEVSTVVGLDRLQNSAVAIDVSSWLYQGERATQLKDLQGIRPHLRIVFSRLRLLLRHHVRPVVVFEGSAPRLKQRTLEKRAAVREEFYSSQDACPSGHTSPQAGSGGRVSSKVAQCQEMLSALGVPYITAPGEAEATCALLNTHGLVDACITEDSDVFLFGARRVYRNFSVKSIEDQSLEFIDMDQVEAKLNLTREKLVALALLTGCDYHAEGVKGIGPEQAVRLLQEWPSAGTLDRMRGWTSKDCDLAKIEADHKKTKKPSHCSKCDHLGGLVPHKSSGCECCASNKGCLSLTNGTRLDCPCDWHLRDNTYKQSAMEIKVRGRAIADKRFPHDEIISEFLADPELDAAWPDTVRWSRPDYTLIQSFLSRYLQLDAVTSAPRILPLVTAWDIREVIAGGNTDEPKSVPERILHARSVRKVKVVDVQWRSVEGVPAAMLALCVPPSPCKADAMTPGVTMETRTHIETAFPWLVRFFDNERAPAKAKKRVPIREQIRDQVPTRQTKLDKIFKVKKRLNFSSEVGGQRSSCESRDSVQGSSNSPAPSHPQVSITQASSTLTCTPDYTLPTPARTTNKRQAASSLPSRSSRRRHATTSPATDAVTHKLTADVSQCHRLEDGESRAGAIKVD